MNIPIYYINTFTTKLFHGNPAAVCFLPEWLSDNILHSIARENNLPVTAFIVRDEKSFSTRWITPEYELDLCGHGSLATGFVIFNFIEPSWTKVYVHSRREKLEINRDESLITLNFQVLPIEPIDLPALNDALGSQPIAVYQYLNERCLAVFDSEEEIIRLTPDMSKLKKIGHRGFVVTAKGNLVDFVSRTFYPYKSLSEDPATGASHCLLIPYWSKELNKKNLHALQLSNRGGELFCTLNNDRVLISGEALLYMQGYLEIEL